MKLSHDVILLISVGVILFALGVLLTQYTLQLWSLGTP